MDFKKAIAPLLFMACAALAGEPAVIPQPSRLDTRPGNLTLDSRTIIAADAGFVGEANDLAERLRRSTGLPFERRPAVKADGCVIRLTAEGAKDLGSEGYTMETGESGVMIRAKAAAGIFYGCQTLLQLLPPEVLSAARVNGVPWSLPFVIIEDQPRFAWRGLMLDVSRHFYDKSEVEAVLDQMATLKLNVFHWHLTDDSGWRIEIKKFPKLTSVGAWRAPAAEENGSKHSAGGRYGGFYTQEEVREVVAYAAARHIAVIPEIDIPGHFAAALVAYPELAPDNGWTPVIPPIGAGTFALCAGKGDAVTFCKNVLEEVLALFPSKLIHIGGDEVDFKQWNACKASQEAMKTLGLKDMTELQIHFTNEMVAFLESKGRRAIVWNNIYRQTVDKRAINQFWRPPMNHTRDFANAGYDVLLSDSSCYYFDRNPPLAKAYGNDPLSIQGLSPAAQSRILGIEGCEWTERIPSVDQLQPHLYPRLIAYAETGWTSQERKDADSFKSRLATELLRLDRMGVRYNTNVAQEKLGKELNY